MRYGIGFLSQLLTILWPFLKATPQIQPEIVYENLLDFDTYTIRPEVGELRYSSENLHGNREMG